MGRGGQALHRLLIGGVRKALRLTAALRTLVHPRKVPK